MSYLQFFNRTPVGGNEKGSIPVVRELLNCNIDNLKEGIDINLVNNENKTPLYLALSHANDQIASLILCADNAKLKVPLKKVF